MTRQTGQCATSWRSLLAVFLPTSRSHQLVVFLALISLAAFGLSQVLNWWVCYTGFVFCTYLIVVRFVRLPMKALLRFARSCAFNNVGDIPNFSGQDEFSRLGHTVGQMARRLRASVLEARGETTKLDEIFSAIGDGVILISREGLVLKINNTVRRWTGCYGEVKGCRLIDIIRNVELADRVKRMVDESALPGSRYLIRPEILEILQIEEQESKLLRAKIVPMPDAGDEIVFIIFLFDLTDIQRIQEIRREFFANASHELKTPMAAIRGYAESINDMECIAQDPIARNFVSVILRNAEHLGTLIDEMLLLSGLESRTSPVLREEYDLCAALVRVVETMKPKADEARVSLQIDVPKKVELIWVDAQKFDSVLLNLLDNGIKYNRPDGFVKISLRQTDSDSYVYVEDNGIGIAEAAQQRVFERFFRADKSHRRLGGGSGLGLAIVKHIVQAHNGSISLRSALGVGTVLSICIPKISGNR